MKFIIRKLGPKPKEGEEKPETYVGPDYMGKTLKRGKYELIEESTLQSSTSGVGKVCQ